MEILNSKQVAELLHSDVRTIQRKADSGKFPQGICGKFGRFWLFDKEKLLQYIFNNN